MCMLVAVVLPTVHSLVVATDSGRGGQPLCGDARLIGYQLDRLLKSLLPRLWRHFQDVGLSFEVLAAQWLLPLMSITLPFPTLARIWELFFAEVR